MSLPPHSKQKPSNATNSALRGPGLQAPLCGPQLCPATLKQLIPASWSQFEVSHGPKNQAGYFPSNTGCLRFGDPYVMAFFFKSPHNWGADFIPNKYPQQPFGALFSIAQVKNYPMMLLYQHPFKKKTISVFFWGGRQKTPGLLSSSSQPFVAKKWLKVC